jgi:hypothetical protein
MLLNWFRKRFLAPSRPKASRPQTARKQGRSVPLSIETLEERQLLSATVANGVLSISGDYKQQSDTIMLRQVPTHALEVTVNGQTFDFDNFVDNTQPDFINQINVTTTGSGPNSVTFDLSNGDPLENGGMITANMMVGSAYQGTNALHIQGVADATISAGDVSFHSINPGFNTYGPGDIKFTTLSQLDITSGATQNDVYPSFTVNGTAGVQRLTLQTQNYRSPSLPSAASEVDVYATDPGTQMVVTGGDQLNVHGANNNLDSIHGSVTFQGGGASTQVSVDDSASSTSHTYTLGGSGATRTLQRSGAALVTMDASDGLGISAGTGTSNTLVGPNMPNTTWHITGHNCGDVNGVTFWGMQNLTGGKTPVPAYCSNVFLFSDGASIDGTLRAHNAGDYMNCAQYTTPVSVNLATSTVAGIVGKVYGIDDFVAGAAKGTLTAPSGNNTWDITGTNDGSLTDKWGTWTTFMGSPVYLTGTAVSYFSGFDKLVGGTGSNTFTLHDTGAVTGSIQGQGGDTLSYAPSTSAVQVDLKNHTGTRVASFAGITNLVGSASTNDTLSGPADPGTTNWSITGSNQGTIDGSSFTFNSFENLTTQKGVSGSFSFANGASVSGKVTGGGTMQDSLDFSKYGTPVTVDLQQLKATSNGHTVVGAVGSIQSFSGPTGLVNTLIGPYAASTYQISNADTIETIGKGSELYFTSFGSITAGPNNDTFTFTNGATLSGSIQGGGGTDKLDYSACTTGVTVNLQLHTATGVGGTVTGIRNVTGGSGNDILVGDSNPNVLIGGGGSDLIIGGGGPDTLDAGSGDDILICGKTDWDTLTVGLTNIRDVWAQSHDPSQLSGMLYTNGPFHLKNVYLDNVMDTVNLGSGSKGWIWGIEGVDFSTAVPSGWTVSS